MKSPVDCTPALLAIESSCDETAAAILGADGGLLASEVASQIELHRVHGGVVPEVASRRHLELVTPVVHAAMAASGLEIGDIGIFAATSGPGLASALLVGNAYAKGLAIAQNAPFLGINHLEGHLLSPFFGIPKSETDPLAHSIGLIVSGGHTLLVEIRGAGTYEILGGTLDDAAGEAFDKVGKMLGLPYPAGPEIDRLALQGDPKRYDLPRSMAGKDDLRFSFSGLKTAVRYLIPKLEGDYLADLCASFQEAVVSVLVRKTLLAAEMRKCRVVGVSGGVGCNGRLRAAMQSACREAGIELYLCAPSLATDNATMIAHAARLRWLSGLRTSLDAGIDPNWRLVG